MNAPLVRIAAALLIQKAIASDARRATKYISDKLVIRATRRQYKGTPSKGNIEITLTIGKPNFLERKFIKACKKAGERFPVKNTQMKWFPAAIHWKKLRSKK